VAQLGAATVGGLAVAVETDMLHAPLPRGELQLRGLAVDEHLQVLQPVRQTQGRCGSGAVGFLAHHAQPGQALASLGQQRLHRRQLGHDLALGIAGAAAE